MAIGLNIGGVIRGKSVDVYGEVGPAAQAETIQSTQLYRLNRFGKARCLSVSCKSPPFH